jgi:hypothetical protein
MRSIFYAKYGTLHDSIWASCKVGIVVDQYWSKTGKVVFHNVL